MCKCCINTYIWKYIYILFIYLYKLQVIVRFKNKISGRFGMSKYQRRNYQSRCSSQISRGATEAPKC